MKISRYTQRFYKAAIDLFYCPSLVYHKGKGLVIDTMLTLFPSSGRGQRHVLRQGILWELDLECWVQRNIYYGCYEPWETLYLRQVVKTGWTVIDVGANIGYYSLLLGQWVGPKGSVHAFEPQPVIFEQLCRHIILNKIDWIKPHQRALGDTIEQRFMTDIPEWNKGMQRIATDKDKGVNQVEITTLDEFVKYEELDRIDFIKVDIEGYEFKFLKGAKQSLNKFRPLILIELNPEALIAQGTNMAQVLDLLIGCGYVLYQINNNKLNPLKNFPASGKCLNIVARPTKTCKEVSLK